MDYTKGEWIVGDKKKYNVDRYSGDAEWARIRNNDGLLVARVESANPAGKRKPGDFNIEESNARLISASPDLLEVCKKTLDILYDNMEDMKEVDGKIEQTKALFNEIQNIINKAEGK